MSWDCSGIVVGPQGPGGPLSQAGAYHTWPKHRPTPTFPGNLATGWATSTWDLSLPSLGLGMLMLQPQGPQPSSPSGPTGDCWLWGTHPSGRPHTKPNLLLCPLQSPSPRSPPRSPRRVPALSRGYTEGSLLQRVRAPGQVPVCTRACACVCPPYVYVCACACGGRARPPLGAPTARPAAAPAPAPARGAGEAAGVGSPTRGTGRGSGAAWCGASAGRADRAEKRERSPVHGAGPQPGAGAGNRRAEPGGKGGSVR